MLRRSTSGRSAQTSRPRTNIAPAVGSSSRLIRRRLVVLPQPLGPRRATTDPAAICKLMPSTARLVGGKMAIQLTASPHDRTDQASLLDRYSTVRRQTEALCDPLEVEDYLVQSMPEASPVKWHLAHTSWFFETFILQRHAPG